MQLAADLIDTRVDVIVLTRPQAREEQQEKDREAARSKVAADAKVIACLLSHLSTPRQWVRQHPRRHATCRFEP
jgi:hypothetical protein